MRFTDRWSFAERFRDARRRMIDAFRDAQYNADLANLSYGISMTGEDVMDRVFRASYDQMGVKPMVNQRFSVLKTPLPYADDESWGWQVVLPHQCDSWKVTSITTVEDAVAQLDKFITEAQAARQRLVERQFDDDYTYGIGEEVEHGGT